MGSSLLTPEVEPRPPALGGLATGPSGKFPCLELWSDLRSMLWGFPCGSAGKESTCNLGDQGSIPGLGRSPGEMKGYPLQYSGLENSMDCIVHGLVKSQTWLSNFHVTWSMHNLTTTCTGHMKKKVHRVTLPLSHIINSATTTPHPVPSPPHPSEGVSLGGCQVPTANKVMQS